VRLRGGNSDAFQETPSARRRPPGWGSGRLGRIRGVGSLCGQSGDHVGNHDDKALRLDMCLGFVVAADEFSALGAMSVGIFPRPAVGTHFELSRAAT